MQYVRNLSGSVAKAWNSVNPATLSGAIDVIVVEQADGSLACSPFHVRFGKFMTLRPYDRKVEFRVNHVKQDYSMKLGEGGEAFFVFETTSSVPEALQTSPLVSPAASPQPQPIASSSKLPEPEAFDLGITSPDDPIDRRKSMSTGRVPTLVRRAQSDLGDISRPESPSDIEPGPSRPLQTLHHANSEDILPTHALDRFQRGQTSPPEGGKPLPDHSRRSASPPPVSNKEAVARAINLSKKLWSSNIPSQITDSGDLMLDMTGYKATPDESLRAEAVARKILTEELEGEYDIGALIAPDEKGNVWIYSSEEAKEAAIRRASTNAYMNPAAMTSEDAISDPGYHSDDARSDGSAATIHHQRRDSDSAVEMSNPNSPTSDQSRNYAKTLRLTSDQLKALDLKAGPNPMSFSVNSGRTSCQAFIYFWKYDVPIVISDIDGTITKSDALGHVLNMIGRDWTHLGVAKLYTDIVANGYNIFYLTSRSVGQADTTRNYLSSVVQEGYKLPRGPVIMSPDRTIAALRREIYLRKPEVFKMACLRDIMNLFVSSTGGQTPFYAGFGNRLTDALSYRSVKIPSTRIFTINSNAEVSLDLLTLGSYRTGYTSMREIVDHYFPPVSVMIRSGGEEFTDFNYWRDRPLDIEDFSASESEDEEEEGTMEGSLRSEDEGDMEASYFSERPSMEQSTYNLEESIIESIEDADETERHIMNPHERQRGPMDEDEDDGGDEDEYDEDDDDDGEYDGDEDVTPMQGGNDQLKADLRELAGVLNTPEKKRVVTPR